MGVDSVDSEARKQTLFFNDMEKEYRYTLEKGSKKYHCPECNKKTFVRYIDTETGNYLPEQYGRCDRENNCAYHLNPYKDGYGKETDCTFIEIDEIKEYSEKAFLIIQNEIRHFLPKAVVFERAEKGIFVADYFLNDASNKVKLKFNTTIKKSFSDNDKPEKKTIQKLPIQPKKVNYFIPVEVLELTRSGYEQNVFIQNLLTNVE